MKVGSKVKINKQSWYFGREHQLPDGVIGTIWEITDTDYPYKVAWNNGRDGSIGNVYRGSDLIVLGFKEYLEKL